MNFIDRMKEPSTWSAIAAGMAAVGISMPAGVWQGVVGIGTGIAVLAGIFITEKGGA